MAALLAESGRPRSPLGSYVCSMSRVLTVPFKVSFEPVVGAAQALGSCRVQGAHRPLCSSLLMLMPQASSPSPDSL